jgi:ubiquitin carboxyl-terminal hydrolase L5
MFNLLAVRSHAIPRLERLVTSDGTGVLADQLEHEKHKAERGRVENALRRNNLLPAVFAMLKAMGEGGLMGEYECESANQQVKP